MAGHEDWPLMVAESCMYTWLHESSSRVAFFCMSCKGESIHAVGRADIKTWRGL